jgi:glycosyltransferase involved in cell wall biosynthesis
MLNATAYKASSQRVDAGLSAPSRRPRVLLVAHLCNPYRGGEYGVGWHRAVETAKYCDTWVLLSQEEPNQPDINQWLEENGPVPGLRILIIPGTPSENFFKRIPGFWYLIYNRWQRRAYRVALRLHQEQPFDLMQQVTICGYREPGYLWKIGAPFIWGPVGGTQNHPWGFFCADNGWWGAAMEALRSVINTLQMRFGRRIRLASRKAAVVLAANSTNRRDLEKYLGFKPVLMLDTGLTRVQDSPPPKSPEANRPFKILWSGVFAYYKGLHLLLAALSQLSPTQSYELRILGHGPLGRRWRRIAARLGVAPRCTWLGWLPHSQAVAQYAWADAFIFTSLRDTSGSVNLEALSYGVPVICLDHQGVGDIVTSSCGVKIPVNSPGQVIAQLRDTILSLAKDGTHLAKLSQGALERARHFLWSKQGARTAEIYGQVLKSPQPLEPRQ